MNTPVPIILAITIAIAVVSENLRIDIICNCNDKELVDSTRLAVPINDSYSNALPKPKMNMQKPLLISDPSEVTAAWLSDVFRYAGLEGTVNSFKAHSIGTGQVGENIRFELIGSKDIPKTVVGKFPSNDPISRQTGIDTYNYIREVHFYKNLQSKVLIETPDIFYTEADIEKHDFVIMMEDLAPGEQGDQLGGCDHQKAELAMIQLAHLHGPLWGDTTIVDDVLISNRKNGGQAISDLFNMVSNGFLARYSKHLTQNEKEMVQLVGDNLEVFMASYAGEQTLVHLDYRLDNMMFGGAKPLTVVDWQSPAFDCAIGDVSYFMGTSIMDDTRKEVEEKLVKKYFETLSTYNVSMTWDECWHYYRHYAPAGLIMAGVASMIVGETKRGNEMFMVMAKRSARMSRDLDAIGAIRGSYTT